ncbi:hypothetical protein P1P68_06125 [Streptomyces scabiei]|uniref:hypothetical protein n=1 Tax=Streptomyces scabiei TaxID=1930 RepID=UPI002990168C|nr:hypothetical protein [Streptomyces scabiei]MDW8804380.1 hypothetical protein [Streptomyces scabiei]
MGSATRSVGNQHQQLDASKGVYGQVGRTGQERDARGTLGLFGLQHELVDLGGEHVNVVRQRIPLVGWSQRID